MSNGTMLMGYNIEENPHHIKLAWPVGLFLSNPYSLSTSVLGYKYSPFAADDEVIINKSNIDSRTVPVEYISNYYEDLVKSYQAANISFRGFGEDSEEDEEVVSEDDYYNQLGEEILEEISDTETNTDEDTTYSDILRNIPVKNKTFH